jgi:sialate O-acetylesterase
MEAKEQPSESDWALLREAQFMTLSLPHTGMVVAIDLGEWNDIHPVRKLEVGYRLALSAQNVAYGDHKTIYSGPTYQSMNIVGDKIVLTFTNIGTGLLAKGDSLKGFSIAGSDKKFIWAKARIEKNHVIVWSEKVPYPTAIRYAWADNPVGANLYNREGLPASPFRTYE